MPEFTNATEAMKALCESTDQRKVAEMDATVLFDLSGEGGGQWTANIGGDQMAVTEGSPAAPTVTLEMTAADFVAMVNRKLNPVAAFMQGRIKVKGDMSVAMRLQTLFV